MGRPRVLDELGDVNPLTRRRERLEPGNALPEQDRRAVEIAVAPVVEPDADLQDAVIEVADRRARLAPQRLDRLVLLEELAGVEPSDAAAQRLGRWVVAACAEGLADPAAGNAFRRPGRLAVLSSRPERRRR